MKVWDCSSCLNPLPIVGSPQLMDLHNKKNKILDIYHLLNKKNKNMRYISNLT